jgi:hypothetical protein
MTSIKMQRAETRRFGIVTDADQAQMRIGKGGSACHIVEGSPVLTDDGSAGFSFTLAGPLLDLSPRIYPLAIWTRTGPEWQHRGRQLLSITGGC